LGVLDASKLAPHSPGEHGKFFAHRRRRRGLPMGVGKQRHLGESMRHLLHLGDEPPSLRQPDPLESALDHEGVREVVDVLTRAPKMDELRQGIVGAAPGQGGETVLEEVLDGLDVMLSCRLNRG
jgi:hypothetical protein